MKTIDCPNTLIDVQLSIGDDVVWSGKTSYSLAAVLGLWAYEIEASFFSDEEERIFVPLTLCEVDKIVGALIERKIRDLKKKGSDR